MLTLKYALTINWISTHRILVFAVVLDQNRLTSPWFCIKRNQALETNWHFFSGFGHVFPNRVLQVSQTRGFFHGSRGSLYSLEANGILLRRLRDGQKGRRVVRSLPHEAQRSQQKRFRFRNWHWLCRRIVSINRKEQISHAMIFFSPSLFAKNYLKFKSIFLKKEFFLSLNSSSLF